MLTEVLYFACSIQGLNYGPRFRTFTGAVVATHLATGVVKHTTASESWERHSFNHPGILDGALHSIIAWQIDPQN
jgi:hypothetical protein